MRKQDKRRGGGLRRVLKALGVTLGVLAFVLFFGTITLVFNPFEGGFGDVTMAIPRTVDFCFRKEALGEDFPDFPVPSGWEDIADSNAWMNFQGGPTFKELDRKARITARLDELESSLAQAPIDLFSNLATTDLAVAGILQGSSLERTRWCVYTRVGWKVRAALGLLKYSFTHKWLPPGVTVSRQEGLLQVGTPRGEVFWLALVKDLLLAGNDRDLVDRSRLLALGESKEDPLGASADYEEAVEKVRENGLAGNASEEPPLPGTEEEKTGWSPLEGTPLEFYLNTARIFQVHPEWTHWPDRASPLNLWERIASLFIQFKSWHRLGGALFLQRDPEVFSFFAQVDINRSEADPFFLQVLETKPENNDRFLERVANLTPSRAAVLGAFRFPVASFLHEAYDLLDPSEKDLLQDAATKTGRFQSVDQAIDTFFTGFQPRLGLVVRANDFKPLPDDPKSDGRPVPAVAVILWSRAGEQERVRQFIKFLKRYSPQWGFTGIFALPAGPAGGYEVLEFHSYQISGTGCMAVLSKKELGRGESELILSNSGRLVREMINARFRVGGVYPVESTDGWRNLRYEIPRFSSGLVYVQGAELSRIMEMWEPILLQEAAGDRAAFDERILPEVEAQVLRERYAGYASRNALPPVLRRDFDREVRRRMDARWKARAALSENKAAPFIKERIRALRLLGNAFLHFTTGPGKIQFRGKVGLVID